MWCGPRLRERTSTSVPGIFSASNTACMSASKASVPRGLIHSTRRVSFPATLLIVTSEEHPEDLAVLQGLRTVSFAGGDMDYLTGAHLSGLAAGLKRGRALQEDRHLVLRVGGRSDGWHPLPFREACSADT